MKPKEKDLGGLDQPGTWGHREVVGACRRRGGEGVMSVPRVGQTATRSHNVPDPGAGVRPSGHWLGSGAHPPGHSCPQC